MRWSLTPAAQPVPVPPEELAKRGPNFLETEIVDRIKSGPARWTMRVTVANAGDQTVRPKQGVAGRPSQRRGRRAHRPEDRGRGGRSVPRHQFRSDRAAEWHTDLGRSVPRSPLGRPTGFPTTAARPRKKTTREPPREPPNDKHSADPPNDDHSPLHPAPANAALAHGGLHPGDAVHRRRHGVHGRAEISDARRHSQAAWDRDPAFSR